MRLLLSALIVFIPFFDLPLPFFSSFFFPFPRSGDPRARGRKFFPTTRFPPSAAFSCNSTAATMKALSPVFSAIDSHAEKARQPLQ